MPPILVPSSAKHIATQILVIAKLNRRKKIFLRGFVCDVIRPYKKLSVQSLQVKHKNKYEEAVSLLLTVNTFKTFF